MRRIVLLLLLLPASGSLAAPAAAVVGGAPTAPGAGTFTLALIEADEGRRTIAAAQFCAGALIRPDVLLTAAHCVEDEEGMTSRASELRVFGGRVLPLRKGPLRRVRAVRAHPEFDDGAGQANADIALLRLASPVKGVAPVAIASSKDHAVIGYGAPLRLWGWGNRAKGEGQNFPRQLHDGRVVRYTDARCDDLYGRYFNPVSQLCAGTPDGSVDACQGDSGGPLTATRPDGTPVLLGLVSYGESCGDPAFPTVYTKLSRFERFIARSLKATQPRRRAPR